MDLSHVLQINAHYAQSKYRISRCQQRGSVQLEVSADWASFGMTTSFVLKTGKSYISISTPPPPQNQLMFARCGTLKH